VEVPQGMEASILCAEDGIAALVYLVRLHGDAGLDLRRMKPSLDDVGVVLDRASASREHKVEITFWAFFLPRLQGSDQIAGQGNGAATLHGFRRSYFLIGVGSLPDRHFVLLEVQISPSQTAKLTGAHTCQNG